MHRFGSDKPDLRVARVHRADRRHADVDFKGLQAAASHAGGRRGRVPGGADRAARGEIDGWHRNSSRSTAPRAWPGSRSTTWPRAVRGCSRRSSRTPTPFAAILKTQRRAGRRHPVLRRRQGEGRQRRHRRAAPEDRSREFGRTGLFEDRWAPLWVDFPMFEHDEDASAGTRAPSVHSPRTATIGT